MNKNEFKLISLQGNEDASTILEISNLTYDILKREYDIDASVLQLPATVAEVFLTETLKKAREIVEKDSRTTLINLFGLFNIGFNVQNDEDSEKGGNITPDFKPPTGAELTKDEHKMMEVIAEATKKTLDKVNSIDVVDPETALTISKVFLEQLINRLALDVKAEDVGSTIMINIFDLFDLGYHFAEGEEGEEPKLVFVFSAKGSFKTAGKSDESQSNE